jgi:hypothetical protein
MRRFNYLLAAAAIGGLMALPQTGFANPLAGGLGSAGTSVPAVTDGLVQKVHGWHCRKRKGWYRGHRVWHRHRRACYDDYSYYDDDYYHRPYYHGYHSYPYFPAPFIGFHFGKRRHWGWDDD